MVEVLLPCGKYLCHRARSVPHATWLEIDAMVWCEDWPGGPSWDTVGLIRRPELLMQIDQSMATLEHRE